jgi:tetratricopeptide (TPR) repeat protein
MSHLTTPAITSAQDYLRMANAAFEKQDLPKARECLRAALAFQPEDADLLLALGHVEFGLGLYHVALELYSVVCELDSADSVARSCKALTLKIIQRSSEARAAAEDALTLDPDDRVALKVLARIHIDTGGHDKARALCRRLLNLNPMDAEALQFLNQCRFDLEAFVDESDRVPSQSPVPGWNPSWDAGGEGNPRDRVLVRFPQ